MFPKSALTNGMPGAKMDDASGLTNVMAATKPSRVIFLFVGKFRGFAGSSCESQPTRLLSRSESGYFSGASWSFFVLFLERCFSRSAPISLSVCCGCCIMGQFCVTVFSGHRDQIGSRVFASIRLNAFPCCNMRGGIAH